MIQLSTWREVEHESLWHRPLSGLGSHDVKLLGGFKSPLAHKEKPQGDLGFLAFYETSGTRNRAAVGQIGAQTRCCVVS